MTSDESSSTTSNDLRWYEEDNEKYESWWNHFVGVLEESVPETRGAWVLTGSRSFGLAYPESDIEGALVVQHDGHERLQHLISDHFGRLGIQNRVTLTKAGLRIIVLDNVVKNDDVDIWKLEITIRTPEVQKLIETHISNELCLWTDAQKLEYIEHQRADALLAHSEPEAAVRYLARKKWLKALPAQPDARLLHVIGDSVTCPIRKVPVLVAKWRPF